MPLPKTPSEILADFDEYFPKPEYKSDSDQWLADKLSIAHQKSYHDWLRSSMQSLLLHVMGGMPRKNYRIATNGKDPDKGEIRDCLSAGYNSAITDCLAVIQSTIDSIKE